MKSNELDREHKGQREHVERLERAAWSGSSPEEIARLTEELIEYLQAHFTSEQIAMRESAYPAYQDHVREHDETIARLRELQRRALQEEPGWEQGLEAVRQRLVEHVHVTDGPLSEFLQRGRTTHGT